MSSPSLQQQDNFDATIGREIKNWGSIQKSPKNARHSLMQQATLQQKHQFFLPAFKLSNWLRQYRSVFQSDGYYLELSRMLFSEAALRELAIERRAIRFVC